MHRTLVVAHDNNLPLIGSFVFVITPGPRIDRIPTQEKRFFSGNDVNLRFDKNVFLPNTANSMSLATIPNSSKFEPHPQNQFAHCHGRNGL